eukprot:Opistho-2@96375
MAPIGKIFTYPNNPRVYKALIAAQYAGVEVQVVSSGSDFTYGVTNKSEAFLKKFPVGKVPAFEGADGTHLFESNAIAYYIASQKKEAQLLGKNDVEAAQVQQYVNFADHEIYPASCTWVYPILGIINFNKQASEKAKQDIEHALAALNEILRTKTFLVGERVSLADIVVASTLVPLYENVLDVATRKAFGNVNRWFVTLINQKEFKTVLGDFKLVETAKQPALPAKEDKKKEEKKEKKEEPKKEAPKKEEPKKKEAAPEEDDLLDEEREAPAKDPLGALPKSSFDLDGFKRSYSNDDTITVAIPHFWKNLDKEGYSIWRCDYKYPEELQKVFMTCNLIAGFFQRVEKLRKYAFASMCVFGEDNKNQISGIWVTKGSELVFPLLDDWNVDAPSYNWKKLDINAAETVEMVNEYFAWEGKEFTERKFNQGKIFK